MRTVIGLTENVTFISSGKRKKYVAKIDTGADVSSIDEKLAKSLKIGPPVRSTMIRSANGRKKRRIVRTDVVIHRKRMRVEFSLADRQGMKYRVLIGKNILRRGFFIDPNEK